MANVQHAMIRTDCQHRRPARSWDFATTRQLAGIGVHCEGDDLIFVLEADIKRD